MDLCLIVCLGIPLFTLEAGNFGTYANHISDQKQLIHCNLGATKGQVEVDIEHVCLHFVFFPASPIQGFKPVMIGVDPPFRGCGTR